jgi:hypothetical protein
VSSVIASHLVLTTARVDADPDVVVSRTADLLHPTSHAALAEHVGDLRLNQTDDIDSLPLPPLLLLRSAGPVSAEAARVVEAPMRAWSVILRTPADEAVSAQYAARAAAALLAHHVDGVGVDLAVPRVWPRLSPDADPARTADWFVLERGGGDGTVSTTTRGLARFGLPELRVVGVDAASVPAWDAVLTGLAHRLVADGAGSPPAQVDLGLRDIAAGYAEPVDPDDPTLRRHTAVALTYVDDVAEVTGSAVADLFTG